LKFEYRSKQNPQYAYKKSDDGFRCISISIWKIENSKIWLNFSVIFRSTKQEAKILNWIKDANWIFFGDLFIYHDLSLVLTQYTRQTKFFDWKWNFFFWKENNYSFRLPPSTIFCFLLLFSHSTKFFTYISFIHSLLDIEPSCKIFMVGNRISLSLKMI
jgi:hypothetical protein